MAGLFGRRIQCQWVRIIDCNVLYGFWPRRRVDASLEAVVRLAAAYGISRQVLCSMRGMFQDFVQANTETLDACRSDARRAPAASLNPLRFFEGVSEVDRMAASGVRLFRFFPEHQGWDYRLRPFESLLRRIRDAGGIAMTGARLGQHLEAGAISQLLRVLQETGAPCVLTGVYYGNLAECLEAGRAYPALYVETHLLNGPDSLEVLATELDPSRLIYGSGAPLHYMGSSLLPLEHCALDERAKAGVAGQNLARLLGWSDGHH